MTGATRFLGIAIVSAFALGLAAAPFVLGGQAVMIVTALGLMAVAGLLSLRVPLIGLGFLLAMTVTELSANLTAAFGVPGIAKLAAPGLMALLGLRFLFFGDRPFVGLASILAVVAMATLKLSGAAYAIDWASTLQAASDFVKDAVIALLALAFMAYARGLETVTISATLSLALICALGLVQFAGGPVPEGAYGFAAFGEGHGRFTGVIDDANFFAALVVFAIPIALFHVLNATRPDAAIGWAVVVAVLLGGLLLTQSRGGLLACGLGLAVAATGMSRRQFGLSILLGGVVVTLVMTLVGQEVVERLATIGQAVGTLGAEDTSTEGRLASWQVAFQLFREHPWLGIGADNFELHYQDEALEQGLIFRGEGRSTHSLYIEFLVEQGLLGLGVFLAILAWAFGAVMRGVALARAAGETRLARHVVAFGAGLTAYLSALILLHDAYPRFLWIVVLIAVEMDRIVRRRISSAPSPRPRPALVPASPVAPSGTAS